MDSIHLGKVSKIDKEGSWHGINDYEFAIPFVHHFKTHQHLHHPVKWSETQSLWIHAPFDPTVLRSELVFIESILAWPFLEQMFTNQTHALSQLAPNITGKFNIGCLKVPHCCLPVSQIKISNQQSIIKASKKFY